MSNFNQPNYDDFCKKSRKRYLRVNENWTPPQQQQVKQRERESAGINVFQQKHGKKEK